MVGIPTDDGSTVSEHFGRSKNFLIAKIENGKVISKILVENPHNRESDDQVGHGRVLKTLADNGVRKVICSNMGPRMVDNLGSLKIAVERVQYSSDIETILKQEVGRS